MKDSGECNGSADFWIVPSHVLRLGRMCADGYTRKNGVCIWNCLGMSHSLGMCTGRLDYALNPGGALVKSRPLENGNHLPRSLKKSLVC